MRMRLVVIVIMMLWLVHGFLAVDQMSVDRDQIV